MDAVLLTKLRIPNILVLAIVLLTLAGCDAGGGGALLSPITASATKLRADGGHASRDTATQINFDYHLSSQATIEVNLLGGGKVYPLRQAHPQRPGDYELPFNGALPLTGTNGVVMQVMPAGDYQLQVKATPGNGASVSQLVSFTVTASDPNPPQLINFAVQQPAIVSPNNDAISDTLQLSYRLNKDARVLAYATDLTGTRSIVQAASKIISGEQSIFFTGKSQFGAPLANGPYTVTVQASDAAGNVTQQQARVQVEGGGEAAATILAVEIGPRERILGDINGGVITVTIKVKNTGTTVLNTQGPDPGYEYSTNDSYSSIGKVDQAGLWRVGVDWNNNRGDSAALRYPFRWGFGHPLQPGEEVTVVGRIRINKQEEFMTFYAALLQEGVRIVGDKSGPTEIHIH